MQNVRLKLSKRFKQCQNTGYADRQVARGLGWSYAFKNDPAQAAYWFEQLITADPSWLERLRGDATLQKALGAKLHARVFGPELPLNISRVEGWRTDLAFLTKTLFGSHYNINIKTPSEVWSAKIKKVHDSIPKLTDKEVALELMKLTALAGDGHTYVVPQISESLNYHLLPVLIYPFKDGFFIRWGSGYSNLVEMRVLNIEDKSIEQLIAETDAFQGHDNNLHHKWLAPVYLGMVEILKMLRETDSD